MFSAEQYRALHEAAGLVERAGRGVLRFTGTERRAFLQGLLTNDILALEAGAGCYAALLTASGRMIADMRVLELADETWLEVDAGRAAALRERFDNSIFSEDAQVEEVSASYPQLGVYGPMAARLIAAAAIGGASAAEHTASLEALALYGNQRFASLHGELIAVRSDEPGIAGFDLFVEAGHHESMAAALRAAGAVAVDPETVEVTRIEARRPRFGVDMDEETIPLEAGIEDRAISLTKGCYVGQEIIIRVLHRGGGRVAKRLVGLAFEPSGTVAARGDVIRSGERQIGVVTSAVWSPAFERPIAMGYVHRDFAEPSVAVAVVTAGAAQPAVVSDP